MENESKKKYKYLQIKEYILNGIYSGEFKVGTLLPTEREIAKMFSVNRITVSRALDEIENMNLIERIQGSGSYVRLADYGVPAVEMTSFSEKYSGQGNNVNTKLIYYAHNKCLDNDKRNLSKILCIKSNEYVHYFRRLRLLNDKPICVQDSYIPSGRIKVVSLDVLNNSFYNYVENDLKMRLGEGTTHVSVITASEEIAKILHIQPKEPIVLSEHIVCTENGLPIEMSSLYYNYRYYYLDYHNKRVYKQREEK